MAIRGGYERQPPEKHNMTIVQPVSMMDRGTQHTKGENMGKQHTKGENMGKQHTNGENMGKQHTKGENMDTQHAKGAVD